MVFVDPPFRKGLLEETLSLLETYGWLANEAWIYVESEVENGLPPVPTNWSLYREKSPGRSRTVCINAKHKEKAMLINLGRLLMLGVWAFLLLNLVQPFPRPLNIFVNVALVFMVLMHGMQLALLKSTLPKDGPQMTSGEKVRIFLFGVFELLVWQKKFNVKSNSTAERQNRRSAILCSSAFLYPLPSAHGTASRQDGMSFPAHRAAA